MKIRFMVIISPNNNKSDMVNLIKRLLSVSKFNNICFDTIFVHYVQEVNRLIVF